MAVCRRGFPGGMSGATGRLTEKTGTVTEKTVAAPVSSVSLFVFTPLSVVRPGQAGRKTAGHGYFRKAAGCISKIITNFVRFLTTYKETIKEIQMNVITKTVELPDGRTISIETGKLAKQADGAVMLRMGNTMLLATVVAAKDAVPGTDFMPLQCDYREKYSAAGRFPGGFTKREGRPSDYEILTSRLVDRALRPLFPDNYHAEVYVSITLYSADGVDIPDALAGFAASAALACSDIPFLGPISECRVARVTGSTSSIRPSNSSKLPTWTSWSAQRRKIS